MDYKAEQKFIVTSPKKLRIVVSMIKKMKPLEAVERLPFSGKHSAIFIAKVIKSAIANAKQKSVNPTDLIFKEILINEGPKLKRFRAGSRGRAKPYEKRMSHIRVILTTKLVTEKLRNGETKKQEIKTPDVNDEVRVLENQKMNNNKKKTSKIKKIKRIGK